jgi:hypothetical protein
LPFAVAGVAPRRFDTVVDRLKLRDMRAVRVGRATGGDVDAGDITAGGNIAAAVSYGDISFAGVGTATAVCGNQVLGFGHPMLWTGPASLSLHPADALYVQEDAFVGFKVANLGGPVGTINQDRIAGIAGAFGMLPKTGHVTSTARTGTRQRTGTSHVNLPDWMPDVAFAHVLGNEDRVFDGIEDLTIDSVTDDSTLSRAYQHATIDRVSIRRHGRWVRLGHTARPVKLRAGHTARFRVDLDEAGAGPSQVVVQLPVRHRDIGRRGRLGFAGGNSAFDGGFGEGSDNETVDKLIKAIQTAPRNDDVITKMSPGRWLGVVCCVQPPRDLLAISCRCGEVNFTTQVLAALLGGLSAMARAAVYWRSLLTGIYWPPPPPIRTARMSGGCGKR